MSSRVEHQHYKRSCNRHYWCSAASDRFVFRLTALISWLSLRAKTFQVFLQMFYDLFDIVATSKTKHLQNLFMQSVLKHFSKIAHGMKTGGGC